MGFFSGMLGGEAKAPKTGSHALPQDVQQWINVDATARTKGTDVATAELDRQLAQGYQSYDPRKRVAGESQAEKEARWTMGAVNDEQDPYLRAMKGLLGKTPEENEAENALARSMGSDLTDKAGIAGIHGALNGDLSGEKQIGGLNKALGRDLSAEGAIGGLQRTLNGDLTDKADIARLHGALGKDLDASDMQGQVRSLTGGDLANEAGLDRLNQFNAPDKQLVDQTMQDRMHQLAGRNTELANNTGNIEALYNPQLQGVIDPTMADMEREYLRSQMANDAAAGDSFGGSRHGVMDAVSLGEYLRGRATVGGQLRSDAWDKAAGLAAGDMDRINTQLGQVTQGLGTSSAARQGAAGTMANIYTAGANARQGAAGVAGQNMERMAGVRQGAADTTARGLSAISGARQGAAAAQAQGVNAISGARQGAVNAQATGVNAVSNARQGALNARSGALGAVSGARQGAASVQAQGLNALNGARTSTINAVTNGLTGLTGARTQGALAQSQLGGNQRQIEQAERDMAYQNFLGNQGFTWDQLGRYNQSLGSTSGASVAAGVPSGGGGAQPADQGWLGKAAGIAGTAAGIAGMFGFCDRRAKRDVEWLDDLVPGVGIYNFRYADDPLGPVYTGVMAQEVELVAPHAVIEMPGGMLAVNFNAFIPG